MIFEIDFEAFQMGELTFPQKSTEPGLRHLAQICMIKNLH